MKLKTGVEPIRIFNACLEIRFTLSSAVAAGVLRWWNTETGDTLRHRFTLHRQQSQEDAQYVPVRLDQHLSICGKYKYKVFPFFRPKKNTVIYRRNTVIYIRMQEDRWIKILQPKLSALWSCQLCCTWLTHAIQISDIHDWNYFNTIQHGTCKVMLP